MGINEYFDKVYCINLDERVDRWELAQKEFESIGVTNVERFSAIKHKNGAIGCRESHLNIIAKAKELGLSNVLIFEDDVKTLEDNMKTLDKSINQLQSMDWDLFYLGATVDPNVGVVIPVTDNLVRTNFAYTTHAYAVNSTMFDTILSEAPNHGIIDVFYNRFIVPRGKSFITNPMTCIQQEGYSDIEGGMADYMWMHKFFNKALEKGIRIKND